MKKLIVLLCVFMVVLAFSLVGCSNSDTFEQKAYVSGENQIEKISVQVSDREVEIIQSEDNQIYIDYFDGEKEYLDVSVSENKELIVKMVQNKNWTDFIGMKASIEYRKIKIRVPNNLIASLYVNTTNENINLKELSFLNEVSFSTNGGNIFCNRLKVGKAISLTAKDGNITGSVIGGWDEFSISCKIKKGDCNLPLLKENGEKSFVADCNNGDIKIEFVK